MRSYKVWREERGYAWRTVYVIDKDGSIRWSKWIEKGAPDVKEVLTIVRALH